MRSESAQQIHATCYEMRASTISPSICVRCLFRLRRSKYHSFPLIRNLRQISTNPNPSLPPKLAHARLTTRRLISVEGADASHFLQGLITANIPAAPATSGFYSAFLNASGRVLYDVFIYPVFVEDGQPQGFLIDVDSNEAQALAGHLKRYKLRAKVNIRLVDDGEMSVWAFWGRGSASTESRANLGECIDQRAPDMGLRKVLSTNKEPLDEGVRFPVETYEIRRIMKGVPEGQNEILKEIALPQESNMDYMGGIDFRKGCYVGQELTIRTHHTGVVRKRILPVQLYGGEEPLPVESGYESEASFAVPPRGSNIVRVDKKGRSAGKFLGGLGNVGLALCRLEVMTDTSLTAEGSPWKPGDEFKMSHQPNEEGVAVKVKAFIPKWHKQRADNQRLR